MTAPTSETAAIAAPAKKKKLYRDPTFQILMAIVLGMVVGHYWADIGVQMKPLGDGFIKLIKMVIGPIIFLTIVTGISAVGDVKKVGKMGVKAIIYFEIVTTLALILGMLSMNLFQPGVGLDISSMQGGDMSKYTAAAAQQKEHSFAEMILGIIPDNIVGSFAAGNLRQILVISVMCGVALSAMGEKGKPVEQLFERLSGMLFGVINIIMKVAPLGAFGAMAFTVGTYGIDAIIPLAKLVGVAIFSLAVFVVGVLGAIATYYRFNLFKLIRYFKDELFIVLGTGSSEPVLPRMLDKLQRIGCEKSVVGLVIPTGYSFNLDGSSLYLSMCVLFVAQAYAIDLSLGQQLTILGILLFTSKGAAGVAGSAFIVLAATVQATGFLPVEGLALLLGVDRLMSSVRAVTNLIGNAVATVVVAKMENAFDEDKERAEYAAYFDEPLEDKVVPVSAYQSPKVRAASSLPEAMEA